MREAGDWGGYDTSSTVQEFARCFEVSAAQIFPGAGKVLRERSSVHQGCSVVRAIQLARHSAAAAIRGRQASVIGKIDLAAD